MAGETKCSSWSEWTACEVGITTATAFVHIASSVACSPVVATDRSKLGRQAPHRATTQPATLVAYLPTGLQSPLCMASEQALTVGSVLPALLSAAAAGISVVYSRRAARRDRLDEADNLARRFREPLLQASHDLQSRLFNIVRQDFLGRFRTGLDATTRDQAYALRNTAFVLAQYLGWVEVVRRESLYLDPRNQVQNRRIAECLEGVRDVLADSTTFPTRVLRIFRGEQRAIGELMLAPANGHIVGSPRWECIGYGTFVTAVDGALMRPWIRFLEEDVETLAREPGKHDARLGALQNRLIDLMETLDPHGERAPRWHKERL
jgi:hypothetical protein